MGKSLSDRLNAFKCAILYSKGWAKNEIARELGISSMMVTKIIEEATFDGIIRFGTQYEITENLRDYYELKDVYVFPLGTPRDIINLAATYLEKRLDDEREGFLLFNVESTFRSDLDEGKISDRFRQKLKNNKFSIYDDLSITKEETSGKISLAMFLLISIEAPACAAKELRISISQSWKLYFSVV